jgi:hypothetical protein
MTADELFQRLGEGVAGLQFDSESTYGATGWRPGLNAEDLRMTSDEFAEFIGLPESAAPFDFDHSGFSGFMGHRCEDDDRMTALVDLMEAHLEQLRVFRSGEATITCYAYGRHESGELLGFTTTLVET